MRRAIMAAPATCCLLAACLLVYLVEILLGGATSSLVLLRLGADYLPLVRAGQWWRLITAAFLHIGLAHLVINMVTLYYIGGYVERLYGSGRFLAIYLISVLAGNLAAALATPTGLAAGASTALFGLFGAFIFLGAHFKNQPALRLLARQYLILIILNLIFDLAVPGISLAGHLGGFGGGFLAGATLGAPRFGPTDLLKRLLGGMILLLGLVVLIKVVFWS